MPSLAGSAAYRRALAGHGGPDSIYRAPRYRSRRSAIARRGHSSDRRCAGRLAAAAVLDIARHEAGPRSRQRPGPVRESTRNCPTACPRRGTSAMAQRAAVPRWSRRKLRPRHWRCGCQVRRQVPSPSAAPTRQKQNRQRGRIVACMRTRQSVVVPNKLRRGMQASGVAPARTAGGNENHLPGRAARMHAILGHTCDIITM